MPDLKLDTETAVAMIGRELDRGIANLHNTAENLVDDLKTVAATLDDPMRVSIADADAACVIDLTLPNYGSPVRHVRLDLSNGYDGDNRVELAAPLPPGKYRAVILLNKIGEP